MLPGETCKCSEDYKIKELKSTFPTTLEIIPFHYKLERGNKKLGTVNPFPGLQVCCNSVHIINVSSYLKDLSVIPGLLI